MSHFLINVTYLFKVGGRNQILILKSKVLYYSVHYSHEYKPQFMTSYSRAKEHSYRAGMHNIRPAGQMWPGEAFNLACKSNISCIQLVCLIETTFEWVKHTIWALGVSFKTNFGPP